VSTWLHGIRAVFFDAVGTLLFPRPGATAVYAGMARRHGLDLDPTAIRQRFLAAFVAEEQIDRAAGWVTSEEREVVRWRRIVFEALPGVPDPESCFRELFDHFAQPSAWTVNPDAAAVFPTLQERSLILGLGSNYDARLRSVVDGHADLAPLRDRVVISAAVGHRKPAAEFFAEVVRVAGCQPGEILFVGDDVGNDYHGADAAGLRPLLVSSRPDHEPDIETVDRWVYSLGELIRPRR
jgi:putative hydrolase of the HAD superfamily